MQLYLPPEDVWVAGFSETLGLHIQDLSVIVAIWEWGHEVEDRIPSGPSSRFSFWSVELQTSVVFSAALFAANAFRRASTYGAMTAFEIMIQQKR